MKALLATIILLLTLASFSQTPYKPKALTTKDYARAEKSMRNAVSPLVINESIRTIWSDEDNFWYTRKGTEYTEIVKVNAKKRTKTAGPIVIDGSEYSRIRRGNSNAVSPDGKNTVFIRENNLWLKNNEDNKETQLTTDGIEDFGYGTNNAGWTRSDDPVLLWSPDSKKIATFQHDGRGVGEMYLVSTNVGHPKLQAWKYPLPEIVSYSESIV